MSTNGTNKSVIACPHCQQRFSVTLPTTSIFNDLKVSTAVATHEKPIRCICGKWSVVVMQSLQIAWGIMPIKDEQAKSLDESSIIVPPPGARLLN